MESAMEDPWGRAAFTPSVNYRDPKAALQWLERAFGFQPAMVITNDQGEVEHAEMKFRDRGYVMIGGEWSDFIASPASSGGRNSQRVHVLMAEGLDAHCEQARAAGADILREPREEFYGDRVYMARDLEGHVWSFCQPTRKVSRAEAEAASGLKIDGWLDD
jgi:uncharacterized glyoxalase superfamily protein PhnB